jgi:iron complex outermembrane recepter protein
VRHSGRAAFGLAENSTMNWGSKEVQMAFRFRSLVTGVASASALVTFHSAAAADGDSDSVEQIIVTGTRVANRSALDTAAPVDVVSADALHNLGSTEVNQALSVALPSYNFPRPGLADGTDTVRPATLRGLAPDQTLVLVNGKRRHSAALVNLNGTIGRGAAAVDLNTIPNDILQSVEVLRDGASAQYGSDAIAGVINLRLRENRDGGSIGVTYGWDDTTYVTKTGAPPAGATWSAPSQLSQNRNDGDSWTISGWKGLSLGDRGFLDVAVEYKDQAHTERGGWDFRQQYPKIGPAFDPREADFDRFNAWYGEPELQQTTVFANAGYDLNGDAKLYGWLSYQDRDAKSAGFFRRALDDRNVIQIYPDGFLPIIAPQVTDYSGAFGTTWKLGEWDMDSSFVYGKNKMEFTIENTLNRSLGTASKTSFDAGGFDYDQLVFNFSGVRPVAVSGFSSPLNVAAGIEARREGYSIFAGEPDSYRYGGVTLPNGTPGAPGSQVFPGFRPSDEVDEHRNEVGAYLDLEANITEKFLASVAARLEDYSDFGSNVSGKLSARYDFVPEFALRGSIQTGFRAPSLAQQNFSSTSTNFINGVPFDILTLPVDDPVARALGAKDLDPEKSKNYSLGTVIRFDQLSITIDAYRIDIDNRIVLSENLNQANVQAYLAAQGFTGIGGARFFINGVDTTTKGVDIVAHYPWVTDAGRFDFTLTANFNNTDVTKVPTTAPLEALNPPPPLFARINVLTFEEGNPKNKFGAQASWQLERFGATLRATRYGEYLTPGTTAAFDFRDGATTLVDIEGRFGITTHLKAAIGADNVFDQYPKDYPPSLNTTGNAAFSNYSPFGRTGRFVYGRLNYDF